MNPSIRQLQIFRAVAQDLSYTRAAEVLNLTQPAVFTQVKQLEDVVGAPLIERIGKRLFLTQAGEIVLASAREVLTELDGLHMQLAELQGMARGRLRLGVVSTAKYDIPFRLGDFCRAHPGIDVQVKVGNRQELLARFAGNEDDLYVLGTPPEELEAEARRYAENPLVLIAPPNHPLATVQRIVPDALKDEPFLMRERGSGTRLAAERFFEGHGIAPVVRMELGANEAIKQAVIAGLGISVLSRGTVQLELDHGILAELDVVGFPLQRHWHVVWPRGKRLSVAAETFLARLLGQGTGPATKRRVSNASTPKLSR